MLACANTLKIIDGCGESKGQATRVKSHSRGRLCHNSSKWDSIQGLRHWARLLSALRAWSTAPLEKSTQNGASHRAALKSVPRVLHSPPTKEVPDAGFQSAESIDLPIVEARRIHDHHSTRKN